MDVGIEPLVQLLPGGTAIRAAEHPAHLDANDDIEGSPSGGCPAAAFPPDELDAEHVGLVRRRGEVPLRARGDRSEAIAALPRFAAVDAAKDVRWLHACREQRESSVCSPHGGWARAERGV